MSGWRRVAGRAVDLVASAPLGTLVAAGCIALALFGAGLVPNSERAASASMLRPGPEPGPEAEGPVVSLRLREVEAEQPAPDPVPVAEGVALEPEAIEALLAPLPALPEPPGPTTFQRRPDSLPPPRAGETVQKTFPPAAAPDPPIPEPDGPLSVVRHAPEGEVAIAPRLTLTFSQPMVALSSLSTQDEAAPGRPVRIVPEPPGQWRWLGTRTLLFEPEGRFPMATRYAVEVDRGARSVSGEALAEPFAFGFSTPPPTLVDRHPQGTVGRTPLVFLGFDQRVDAEAMLPFVSISGRGRPRLRLATPDEIDADESARRLVEGAHAGRFLALVPTAPLARDREFEIRVERGAPSAEGPRATASVQRFRFRTFAPLAVVDHGCRGDRPCEPLEPFTVTFNNALVAPSGAPVELEITPTLPRHRVEIAGRTLRIVGAATEGRTRYRVTLPAELEDVWGQRLGRGESVSFEVGPARAELFSPAGPVATLDPAGSAALPVFTWNHDRLHIRVARVEPSHWQDWVAWQRQVAREDDPGPLPGALLLDEWLDIEGEPDRMAETGIELAPYLREGSAQLVVWVEPAEQPAERWRRRRVASWVQATAIGLTAFHDANGLAVWASALADGRPLEGVGLTLLPAADTDPAALATTDASGLARIELERAEPARVLVARLGSDTAILPQNPGYWGAGFQRGTEGDWLRWFTFEDRGLYRPGETGWLKGWVRSFDPGPGGDVSALGDTPRVVAWSLTGPRGNPLSNGEVELSDLGGFEIGFSLPEDVNLGIAQLSLQATPGDARGAAVTHPIRIEEFRRPTFEVATRAGAGPHHVGGTARVEVEARYFEGGALPGAPVRWQVQTQAAHFVPPHHADYHFGPWHPWWMPIARHGSLRDGGSIESQTDAAGRHALAIGIEAIDEPQPVRVIATASVTDVDRQMRSSSETLLVHPASLTVGLASGRAFVGPGEPIDIEGVVVDLEGRRREDVAVALRIAHVQGGWSGWGAPEKLVEVGACDRRSGPDPFVCRFEPEEGGTYEVTASIHDPAGRRSVTTLRVDVAGGRARPARGVELESVRLVPDRPSYRPGETASILVQAPFHPAEGLVTLRRSGLVSTRRFRLSEPSQTLEVEVLAEHLPGVTLQVDLVGSAPRSEGGNEGSGEGREEAEVAQGEGARGEADGPRRVAYARGSIALAVPPLARTLAVEATPRRATAAPGDDVRIDVRVADADGAPVASAEVAVFVVDEAVLALTDFATPDPIAVFYAPRPPGVRDYDGRAYVLLDALPTAAAAADEMDEMMMAVAEGAVPSSARSAARTRSGFAAKSSPPVFVREDFRALAAFVPRVVTDASGRAHVALKLPDSLTRYRVMAVAAAGGQQFGAGESTLTARLPLMLRPSLPRFLMLGDRFSLSFVVRNPSDEERVVDLALRSQGVALAAGESAGRRVRVPALGRREVRFAASAAAVGSGHVQAVARSGDDADATAISLPIYTPATTEAFAETGTVVEGVVAQPVAVPREVWPELGGLEIETSSTQLQALTDAFLYLVDYPFDCTEQLASRILAVAALRDVLEAFAAPGRPSSEELEAAVARDLAKLVGRQQPSGAIGLWRRGGGDWPFASLHAGLAMARARAEGFEVDAGALERSRQYARQIDRHLPEHYGEQVKWTLRARALAVLREMGTNDLKAALRLLREAGLAGLPLEAQGWILPVLHEGGAVDEVREILRHWQNRVAESAATAHFATSYGEADAVLFHSRRRADAVLLEAMLLVEPNDPLAPKLVRGLLDHRTRGRWSTTQENAFVLLALDRYFDTFEAVTPDFVARAWLGDRFAGEHRFEGRTTERARIDVPMATLQALGDGDLVLSKEGPGRLYYRLGLRYAPNELDLEPAERGFAVRRDYEPIDHEDDVRRDPDGAWRVRAGARVRVTVAFTTPMRRFHVALVDALPAGFEALNPTLAGVAMPLPSPTPSPGPARSGLRIFRGPWFEHQNLRDERVEAFRSLLPAGVYEYQYVARATTPGEFVAPPARAEEMYHPETFGRSATDRVVIED